MGLKVLPGAVEGFEVLEDLAVFGEDVTHDKGGVAYLDEPIDFGGGYFGFAEGEGDGEPDGYKGVGVCLFEIRECGEGAGDDGFGGG